MRRTVGVVVGALTALTVAGAVGFTAHTVAGKDRPVGTWQAAPGVARTPAAAVPSMAAPTPTAAPTPSAAATAAGRAGPAASAAAPAASAAAPAASAAAPAASAAGPAASAAGPAASAAGPAAAGGTEAANGRRRVGTLKAIDKTLGYVGRPQRETFTYPGASYVKLHFSRMLLLPGDYVTVSDAAGREAYRYEAPPLGDVTAVLTGKRAAKASDRWAMSVTGDTAVLELHRGAARTAGRGYALGRLGVNVDKVARGNSAGEQAKVDHVTPEPVAPGRTAPGRTGREESICGGDQSRDAICYRTSDPAAYTRSKAVARLLINGTELCTGWRVGARNRMLTNNHCFDNSADAYQTEVWFNYQCAVCGGYRTARPTKVWGDRVLATNRIYDYTLFTTEQFSLIKKFGHLTLDARRPNRNEALYLPQHPAGKPTRIAGARGEKAANCKVIDRDYNGYAVDSDIAYYCDTTGGSSGSPVLSRVTHKVVALHHFGGCPNSGVRADLLLAKIKKLL